MPTVYVVGHGKTQQDNPIHHSFSSFFMTFLIDLETDIILDASGTFILPETTAFIKTLFIGRSILESTETIWNLIESRYWGSSQKAIHIAFKDAQRQYQSNKSKFK
jgi:hypothetical protein